MDAKPECANPNATPPLDAGGLDELVGYDQVEAEWKVPRGTLYYWVARGKIPHVRLGPRSVRFRRHELRHWLESRSVAVR